MVVLHDDNICDDAAIRDDNDAAGSMGMMVNALKSVLGLGDDGDSRKNADGGYNRGFPKHFM